MITLLEDVSVLIEHSALIYLSHQLTTYRIMIRKVKMKNIPNYPTTSSTTIQQYKHTNSLRLSQQYTVKHRQMIKSVNIHCLL